MITFVRPELLWLALVWFLVWAWFARHQRRACGWIWERVDERFRERFTLYRRATLGRHLALLLILGLLLVVVAAGPAVEGKTEVRALSGRLVVLLDGSASMLADDVETDTGDSQTRFDRGREIAAELGRRLEGSELALVVFSGVAALQLPLTSDQATIAEAMTAASFHAFYRSSGSSFTAALDSVLHFVEPGREDLQAVLLSDGEQPFAEPYEEPLAALAERGVPVHAVAIGSRAGQSRVIYDFRDVVAGKEERRVLREYTTRREDRHLLRITRETGGRFTLAQEGAGEEIAAAVLRRIERGAPVRAEGRRDLGAWPLALFLIGFLLEALVWGRRRRRPPAGFDIRYLGDRRPAAAAGIGLLVAGALLAGACRSDTPLARASRENERGIAADALENWAAARVHYDRSRAYELRPEIPAYNLARSVTLQEDWSEAHRLYQQALELEPALASAHYNDGHALYRWGEAELDLESCEIERTVELWRAAVRRFATAADLSAEESQGRRLARRNHRFVRDRIAAVEETCRPPESPAGGGGAGGGGAEGEEEQQGGGGGEQQQGGSGAEQEQQQGESGGEQEQEGGGGGGGGEEEEQEDGAGGGGEEEQEQGGGGGDEDESEGDDGGEPQETGEQGGGGETESQGEQGEDPEDEGSGTGDEEESQGEPAPGDEEEREGGGAGESEGESGEAPEPDPGDESGPGEGPGSSGGAGGRPLSDQELEQIRQALERIGAERFADGRYHYRTGPEQFPREVWENPEAEIWW